MLSTRHKPEFLEEASTGGRERLKKPEGILAYNKGKIGINLSDQMAAYGTSLRKGLKETICLITSWNGTYKCLDSYKKATGKSISLKFFKEMVCLNLLGRPEKLTK